MASCPLLSALNFAATLVMKVPSTVTVDRGAASSRLALLRLQMTCAPQLVAKTVVVQLYTLVEIYQRRRVLAFVMMAGPGLRVSSILV